MWPARGIAGSRLVLPLALLIVPGPAARCDGILLRGGGEIQGKVVADPQAPGSVQVFLLKGRKPLTLRKEQIRGIVPRPSPLDEYVVRRARLAAGAGAEAGATPTVEAGATAPSKSTATAQAQAQAEYDLGLWCEAHRLADLAQVHYEQALARDGSFEPAHKKLGHILHDGQWLSRDEFRQAQGLVRDGGRWITEEEKAKRDESSRAAAAQAGWVRRIRLLRQAILTASEDRRREAESELMRLEAPEAVGALVKVLGKDPSPLRLLMVHALGRISGKESSRALVEALLAEPEDEVRTAALERLKERDEPEIARRLVQALGSRDVRVVNRAAWALGQLGEVLAVPRLVGALLSTEERLVLVPPEGGAAATGPVALPGPVLMGMNQSFAAYLTGPAMAPGAVAFGATTVPTFGTIPLPGGTYFGMGAAPSREPQPRYVTYTYQNVEVRNALQRLTGQDFGYDAAAWRQWIKTSFNPNPKPVRQVQQP